jgi:hypothetical protein
MHVPVSALSPLPPLSGRHAPYRSPVADVSLCASARNRQAYNCLTDVLVRDLLATTVHRYNNPAVMGSPAYKYLLAMEDKTCHLEVSASGGAWRSAETREEGWDTALVRRWRAAALVPRRRSCCVRA